MVIESNLRVELGYYDFKDDRKRLQETIEKYDVYRKKLEIIEKTREKINSEIETCQKRMKKNEAQGVFEKLEPEVTDNQGTDNTADNQGVENTEFSSNNEFDELMDFDNVNNSVIGGDQVSAYSDPARIEAIDAASDKAGFARGYASGEGNNCFIQSLLQGIHYVNNTKAKDPQKSREEAAIWEQILRDEAVVNGFERNGHLGVTYGKEDQIPANSPYNLHKTDGTADNNFRQQLRLNLDNHVLTIYRYNETTGKIDAADIIKGVNAGKNGKSVKIDMLYDRNHFDPLFAKANKSDPKSAENMKEILNSTLRKFISAIDVWRNSETVIDAKLYRGGTDQRRINSAEKRYSTSSGNKKRDRRDDAIYENRLDDKKRLRRDDAIYENRLDDKKRDRRDDAIYENRSDGQKRDQRIDAIYENRSVDKKRDRRDDAIYENRSDGQKRDRRDDAIYENRSDGQKRDRRDDAIYENRSDGQKRDQRIDATYENRSDDKKRDRRDDAIYENRSVDKKRDRRDDAIYENRLDDKKRDRRDDAVYENRSDGQKRDQRIDAIYENRSDDKKRERRDDAIYENRSDDKKRDRRDDAIYENRLDDKKRDRRDDAVYENRSVGQKRNRRDDAIYENRLDDQKRHLRDDAIYEDRSDGQKRDHRDDAINENRSDDKKKDRIDEAINENRPNNNKITHLNNREAVIDEACEKEGFDRVRLTITPDEKSEAVSTAIGADFANGVDHRNDLKTFENYLMGKNNEERLSTEKRIITWCIALTTSELIVASVHYEPSKTEIKNFTAIHMLMISTGKGKYKFEPLLPKDNKKNAIREKIEKLYEQEGKLYKACQKFGVQPGNMFFDKKINFIKAISAAMLHSKYGRMNYQEGNDWTYSLRGELFKMRRKDNTRAELLDVYNLIRPIQKVIESKLGEYRVEIMECVEGKNKEPELRSIRTLNKAGSEPIFILRKDMCLYLPLMSKKGAKKKTRTEYATTIEQKIDEAEFILLKAVGKSIETNSLLYSIKQMLDNSEKHESDVDEVEKWVNNLRIKAETCGFTNNDIIHVNYEKNSGGKDRKAEALNMLIEDALGEYTLKIMAFDPDEEIVKVKKIIIGRKSEAKIQDSKTIYIFDNGKYHYDPLINNESSFTKAQRRLEKHNRAEENKEILDESIEKEGFSLVEIYETGKLSFKYSMALARDWAEGKKFGDVKKWKDKIQELPVRERERYLQNNISDKIVVFWRVFYNAKELVIQDIKLFENADIDNPKMLHILRRWDGIHFKYCALFPKGQDKRYTKKVLTFYKKQQEIKNACEKAGLKLKINFNNKNGFLYAIVNSIENDNGEERKHAASIWVENLRNEAERCGIEKTEVIGMDNLYDEFRKVLAKELGEYKLIIMKCIDDKRNGAELKPLLTINPKGTKKLYILDNGENEYLPLFNDRSENEAVNPLKGKIDKAPLITEENSQGISQYRSEMQIVNTQEEGGEEYVAISEELKGDIEHPYDPPELRAAFKNAIDEAKFTRGTASADGNNCLLYSLKKAIDKADGIESNDAAVEGWVNDLRKAAIGCGFGKTEFLGITDILEGTPDQKFGKKLAEGVLRDYVLETWGFNKKTQELEWLHTLAGVNTNGNSKIIHVFFNGENHYEPLFTNIHRERSDIEQKIKENEFTREKAMGSVENSFLYSLKTVLDKKNGVASDEDKVKSWVTDLRKKAWMSGFNSKDNIHVITDGQDNRKNNQARKFLNYVKKELGEYALIIMKYVPDKNKMEEDVVIGEKCDHSNIDESKKLYIFDNGNYIFDPLLKIESSPNDDAVNAPQKSVQKIKQIDEDLKKEYGLILGPENKGTKNSLLYSIMAVLEHVSGIKSNEDDVEKWIHNIREMAEKYLEFKGESDLHIDSNKEDEKNSAEKLMQIIKKALDKNTLIFWFYNSENELEPRILAGENSKRGGNVINLFDDGNYHYTPLFPDEKSKKSASVSEAAPTKFMDALNKALNNVKIKSGNIKESPIKTTIADASKDESNKNDNEENAKAQGSKIVKDVRYWFKSVTASEDEKTSNQNHSSKEINKTGSNKDLNNTGLYTNDDNKPSNVQTPISGKIIVPIVVSVKRILGYLTFLQNEKAEKSMVKIQSDAYRYILWKNLKTVNKILIRNYKIINKSKWEIEKFKKENPGTDIPKELTQKLNKIVIDLRTLSKEIGQNVGEFLNDPNNESIINDVDNSIIDIRGRLLAQCNELIECAISNDDDRLEILGKNLGFGDNYSGLKKELNDKKQNVLRTIIDAKNVDYRIKLANHQINQINAKKRTLVKTIVHPNDLGIRFLWDQKLAIYNENIYYCNKMLRAFGDKPNLDKEEEREKKAIKARIEYLTKQRKTHIENHLKFLRNILNEYSGIYDQVFGSMSQQVIKDEEKVYRNFIRFMFSITSNICVLQNELNLGKDKSVEYISRLDFYYQHACKLQNYIWENCKNNSISQLTNGDALEKEHELNEMLKSRHSQEKILEWLKNHSKNGNMYVPRRSFYQFTNQQKTNATDIEERLQEIKKEIVKLEEEKVKVLNESIDIYKNSNLPDFVRNKLVCHCLNGKKSLIKDQNELLKVEQELDIYTNRLKGSIAKKQIVQGVTLNNSLQEISSRPVYKISKDAYPGHTRMLENGRIRSDNEVVDVRITDAKEEYQKNKRSVLVANLPNTIEDYENETLHLGGLLHRDEYPYNAFKQGGSLDAYVEWVLARDNMGAGSEVERFFRLYNIYENEEFEIKVEKYSEYTEVDEIVSNETIKRIQKARARAKSNVHKRGGDLASAYNDPSRVNAIKQASEQAGFTRGYASGEGNNCFIQSLLQGIHYTNGTKANDPQKAQEEAAAWEQILRDEAVVNGFERNGHLGVTYSKEDQIPANSPYDLHKTDGTADNNFRQQLRLNLDNHVLTIYKYNDATGKLEVADIVNGVNAGKNGKSVEIDMLYDRNHFDPLFAKNNKSDPKYAENIKKILNSTLKKFVMALDGWRINKAVKDNEKYRGGTPDQILYAKMDRAVRNSGLERHEASKDGNNCLLYSVKIAIDNADGISHTEQEVKKWVDDFRKILVDEYNWHYNEMLDVGNPFDPKQAALIELLKNTLAEKKLQIWSYDSKQDRLIHMIALTSNNGMSGTKEIHVHLDKYASHYEPLFQISSKQNRKGSTSGLDNKLTEVNHHDLGINTEVLDLNNLIDLLKELLQLGPEIDVPLEIKQKVDNYFKNGCLWKTNGKSINKIINDYSIGMSALEGVSGEISNQIKLFGINDNKEKIINEYLKYYPGERTRIESVPKEDVNLELMSKEVLSKIEEKQNIIDKVLFRINYEVSIYINTKLFYDIAQKFSSGRKENTIQNLLLFTIGNMAKVEVGENFPPQIVNNLINFKPNGNIDEKIKDSKDAAEEYNIIKLCLMNLAINFQWQFGYYDFRNERNGLQNVLDKYDAFRNKMEIIEKTIEKVNSEIEMYKKQMEKNDVSGYFERLENEIYYLLSINSLDNLSTENRKFIDNYITDRGLKSQIIRVAQQYYNYFGIIDRDLKADLGKRIKILENVHTTLIQETRRKRIRIERRQSEAVGDIEIHEYFNRILDKVESDIKICKEFQKNAELEQACTNKGLKRAFAAGNNNNCVLESITKVINRANGSDKENPRKAYEEAAVWQSILRAEAVELGFREKQTFYLSNDPRVLKILALKLIEFKDLTNNKHTKFIEFLRLNLDNHVLTVWKYNSAAKKLDVFNEIKGINAEKEGKPTVWLNVLAQPGHLEPMFANINSNITQSEYNENEEIDELSDFKNVNSSLRGGNQTSAYSDPSRVKAITQASEQAGFTRGKATGEGNNCFIQSLLQGIHNANGTNINDPQKAQEEAATWETILRNEAVVNGFERNGHLGITYGKEDQIPENSPYNLQKTDGTADNNFRQQLRLNLDNHILTIYRYNEATGKLEAADIVKGINAGKNGKSVEIDMLYDRNHFDPLFINHPIQNFWQVIKNLFKTILSKFVHILTYGK